MKFRVEINRSQFDAMPVVVLPVDPDTKDDVIPVGSEVCVFTPAELRARDERIIRQAYRRAGLFLTGSPSTLALDEIIAQAEADQ